MDQMVESDDILRAAAGLPDRNQNTGTSALPVTRSYSQPLCFCTAVSVLYYLQ